MVLAAGVLPETLSTGSGFDAPLLVVSEAPGGAMIAAAGETCLMPPIKHLPPTSRLHLRGAGSGSESGRMSPCDVGARLVSTGKGAADGSVVVVSTTTIAGAAASEAALKAAASATRRKGANRGRETKSLGGGGESVGGGLGAGNKQGGGQGASASRMAEALGDLALFGEGPDAFLMSDRAAAIGTFEPEAGGGRAKSRCQVEAEAAEAEEGGGHVTRAPIFLWRL